VIYQSYPTKRQGFVSHILHPQQVPRTQHTPLLPVSVDNRPNAADNKRADQFKITPAEFVRRDKIVRQLWLDSMMFKVGDVVRPKNEEDYQIYGNITIRGVFKTYHDFPTAEAMQWPKDDRPYIFTVSPAKGDANILLVTAQFMKPFAGNGSTC
jgi:hypothetical protein